MFNPGDETRILHGEVRDEERPQFRKGFGCLQDWFFENTRREARGRMLDLVDANRVIASFPITPGSKACRKG
jgi:hypothetical protein